MADRHRLFFALLPDERIRGRMLHAADQLRSVHNPQGTWTSPDRLHLTLFFLGDYPVLHSDMVDLAVTATETVRVSEFVISLDNAVSFAGKTPPWVLRCAEPSGSLQEFWSSLGTALTAVGFRFPPEPRFVQHVTLLRHADKALSPTAIEPIGWPVRDFVLMHSETGQRRRYSTLQRWPLS